jgi:pimeloyl-ACP methyl ester carboxylesterase
MNAFQDLSYFAYNLSWSSILIIINLLIGLRLVINRVLVPIFLYQPPYYDGSLTSSNINPIVVAKTQRERSMIFFHGNGCLAHQMKSNADLLGELTRSRVYIPEYAGYGCLQHMPYSENFVHLEKVVNTIIQNYHPDKEFVFVGQSLGSYMATRMAATILQKYPEKTGKLSLVLISPFYSLQRLVGGPVFGRLLISQNNFNTAYYFRQLSEHVPVVLIHGEEDTLIPAKHSVLLSKEHLNTKMCLYPRQEHNGFDFSQIAADINVYLKFD